MVAFGFWPKNFGGGRDLRIVILLVKECNFSDVDNGRWWGHLNTKKI